MNERVLSIQLSLDNLNRHNNLKREFRKLKRETEFKSSALEKAAPNHEFNEVNDI
jgi:hypothetical protein